MDSTSKDFLNPYDQDNPNPMAPMETPDLHDLGDDMQGVKDAQTENNMNSVQEKMAQNSQQIKDLALNIAGVLKMVTEQGAAQDNKMDKIMDKLEKRDSSKTRGRSLIKKTDNAPRSSSYPESNKGSGWTSWLTGGKKKDEPEKQDKDLYPSVEIRDNEGRSFVKTYEPKTPAPFGDSQINKLYVAMPGTNVKKSDQHYSNEQNVDANQEELNYNALGARPKGYINRYDNQYDIDELQRELKAFQDREQEQFKKTAKEREIQREQQRELQAYQDREEERARKAYREREQKKANSFKEKEQAIHAIRTRDPRDNPYEYDVYDRSNAGQKIRHQESNLPSSGRGAYGGLSYNEFRHNIRNVPENIETPLFKQSNGVYNTKMVHETIKYLQYTVKLSLTKTSLMAYLRQFSILTQQDFTFTEIEYINIINSFVGPEIQEEQGKHHVWLADYRDDYAGYISMLRGLKSGFYITQNDVLNQLSEINAKNMNIFQLFLTVAETVDSVDDVEWPEKTKNEHLFYYVKRNISPALRQSIDMLLITDGSKNIYPSKRAIKDFCLRAERNQSMGMGKSKRGEYNINKVGSGEQNDGEEKKTYYCDACKRKGLHSTKMCFFNADRELAHQNQIKYKISSCMMCRSDDHMALNCDKYPNEMPVFKFCAICMKRGVKAHHKESACLHKSAEN